MIISAGLLAACLLLYVSWGSQAISPVQVWSAIAKGPNGEGPHHAIVWSIRLPRACETALVGALLATVGSAFQALFRNPLADPYIVGVSSGAAIGGVAAMLLGLGSLAFPGFGFLGGMGALLLVLALSRRRGAFDSRQMLLAGVVCGSMLSALLSLMLLWAGHDTNEVLRWMLGDTSSATWVRVGLLAVILGLGFSALFLQSRALNVLAIGEDAAVRMGVAAARVKGIVLVAGSAMVAVAVGTVGIVGFVGLVAPHIARSWIGADWRRSMPLAALLGALILLLADLAAQRLMYPAELPLGVLTAIVGAPVLLAMLHRS